MGCANGKEAESPAPRQRNRRVTAAVSGDKDGESAFQPVGFTDVQGHTGHSKKHRHHARMTTGQKAVIERRNERERLAEAKSAAAAEEVDSDTRHSAASSPESAMADHPGKHASPRTTTISNSNSDTTSPAADRNDALVLVPLNSRRPDAEQATSIEAMGEETALAMLRGHSVAAAKAGKAGEPAARGVKASVVHTQPQRQFFFMDD